MGPIALLCTSLDKASRPPEVWLDPSEAMAEALLHTPQRTDARRKTRTHGFEFAKVGHFLLIWMVRDAKNSYYTFPATNF